MTHLNISQRFALIALNGQDLERITIAKRMALRGIAAAVALELQISSGCSPKSLFVRPPESTLALYQQTVLDQLTPRTGETLISVVQRTQKLHDKALKVLERCISDQLQGDNLLDTVPSLLGCDLNAQDNGTQYNEYRTEASVYTRLSEGLRAEILEDDQMADENIILFWLLRESGCIHDLFNEGELPTVQVQMQKAYRVSPLAHQLLPLEIHSTLESSLKGLLGLKQKAASADIGIGLNFLFPIFERSQSIFIDTERLYDNNEVFLSRILDRLTGHDVEVLRMSKVPLLRIDNVLYEAVPSAVQVGGSGIRIPVYGARLRRYPLFG